MSNFPAYFLFTKLLGYQLTLGKMTTALRYVTKRIAQFEYAIENNFSMSAFSEDSLSGIPYINIKALKNKTYSKQCNKISRWVPIA